MSIFSLPPELEDDQRKQLTNAITAALRWYALQPAERKGDNDHAVTLIDLLEELNKDN